MIKIIKSLSIFFIFLNLTSLALAKNSFFEDGKIKYNEKKYEESKFLFQRSIVFNPKDHKSYLYLAKIYKLIGGLKSSMGYLGAKKVPNLKKNPNFVKITKAGFYESMVHNVDEVTSDSKY